MRKISWLIFILLLSSCLKDNEFEIPLVFTGEVINITDTSAVFTGKISNHSKLSILESGFIWGVHSNDTNGIKIKNDITPNDIFKLKTNELLANNYTYFVRAYAQTEKAIIYGEEVSFKGINLNIGKWTQLINSTFSSFSYEYVMSGFVIGENAYLIFGDGSLYCYTQETGSFNYVLSNNILKLAGPCFLYNDKVYIFSKNCFYQFDPLNLTFTQLSSRQNENMYWSSGFFIKDNLYIGLGTESRNFWKYNITNDTWTQISTFPGEIKFSAFAFSLNGAGYIGGGYDMRKTMKDFWGYNPEKNQWIRMDDLPIDITNNQYLKRRSTSTNRYGYFIVENRFFEFNPIFNCWKEMAYLNSTKPLEYPYLFAIKNKVFAAEVIKYNNQKQFRLWVYEK